jgi:hypothetical protein
MGSQPSRRVRAIITPDVRLHLTIPWHAQAGVPKRSSTEQHRPLDGRQIATLAHSAARDYDTACVVLTGAAIGGAQSARNVTHSAAYRKETGLRHGIRPSRGRSAPPVGRSAAPE